MTWLSMAWARNHGVVLAGVFGELASSFGTLSLAGSSLIRILFVASHYTRNVICWETVNGIFTDGHERSSFCCIISGDKKLVRRPKG